MPWLGMARGRDDRATRHRDDGEYLDERERRHRRRHKSRDHDDEPTASTRERRERRRAEEARRQAEVDIEDIRARRESYYSRNEAEKRRDRDRVVSDSKRTPAKEKPRSSREKEVRRDSTRKPKRAVIPDDHDDFVFGRPKSMGHVEEVPVRRASGRKRSEEGGSSSRTAYTPHSGSGSASVRRVEVPPLTRNSSTREPKAHTSAREREPRPTVRRSNTVKSPPPTPLTRTQSVKDAARRSTGGILSSFFSKAAPPVSRTPSRKAEEKTVDCLVCMNDDLPITKTVKLACGHRMCYSCLKRQFTLSVKDPAHMPPRCCTSEHIPLKYADRLFDDKFKVQWNRKFQEYTTANRLYCPTKGCGQWIKPSKIKMDPTYGRNKFHTKRECPKDEETNRLVEMAKEKGWQRCYSCKAVVELKEGCNHMTCRCTAQFCMVCAAPWKTCSCPWFNYQHIPDGDQLNDMRVPYPQQARYADVEVIEIPDEPSPPLARRPSVRTPRNRSERDLPRPESRRLSAHLRDSLHLNPTPTVSSIRRTEPEVQMYGVGNAGGHHMNDSYAIRSMPASVARTAARTSTPRTSTPRGAFFTSSSTRRAAPAPAPVAAPRVRPASTPVVTSSTMAGLSRDGRKVGQNRVGTWLTHVQIDPEATNTAARDVEVDDWRCDGTMIGID
ncbi:uncharacterized protein J4E84_001339 [Alternaria hordeiaustralica]|uniref:uncharacterized protein n=1 Tax=Alternaria hordeiaustralica TaxID=1187925 RepID=UPI0020C378B4|nr:uncharacterized protein J4E84_001339 [Alternaria hordeiaustralica]KAI4698204.1 hypothetical protein J4E84_001339 [Alternaria hordeiaustralica]